MNWKKNFLHFFFSIKTIHNLKIHGLVFCRFFSVWHKSLRLIQSEPNSPKNRQAKSWTISKQKCQAGFFRFFRILFFWNAFSPRITTSSKNNHLITKACFFNVFSKAKPAFFFKKKKHQQLYMFFLLVYKKSIIRKNTFF